MIKGASGNGRDKRVITMPRLGLVVGAAMTTLVHFADRLIDVEIASQVLPYRLSVAVVVLLCGSLTYFRAVRDNPDPLVIGLATFLSVAGAAIAARLPDHAGFLMVSGELVIGIFTVIIVHGAMTVTVSIGMATNRDGAEPLEIVMRRPDRELYRAKTEGRNRVCAAA